MATIKRIGFGQVEPNHLSAQRNGQTYASLPCRRKFDEDGKLTEDSITVLENGQFAKYDYAKNEVNFTGAGEWMLVMNEVKVYDDKQSYRHFALQSKNYDGGVITPRLLKTMPGDIFTTNTFGGNNTDGDAKMENISVPNVEGLLYVGADGFLTGTQPESYDGPVFQVVNIYTMPDGQDGVKVMRIK